MIDRKTFSTRFKQLKEDKQVSTVSIGRELGITKQSVHGWEISKTIPSADKLVELADYFDVSLDYLVGRSDDPRRH
ncbi:helix-turn-helix transcriptional regulator [Paenibacillus larvae]